MAANHGAEKLNTCTCVCAARRLQSLELPQQYYVFPLLYRHCHAGVPGYSTLKTRRCHCMYTFLLPLPRCHCMYTFLLPPRRCHCMYTFLLPPRRCHCMYTFLLPRRRCHCMYTFLLPLSPGRSSYMPISVPFQVDVSVYSLCPPYRRGSASVARAGDAARRCRAVLCQRSMASPA